LLKVHLEHLKKELHQRKVYFGTNPPHGSYVTINKTFLSFLEGKLKADKLYLEGLRKVDSEDSGVQSIELRALKLRARGVVSKKYKEILVCIGSLKRNYVFDSIVGGIKKGALTNLGSQISALSKLSTLESEFVSELGKFGFKHFDVETKQRGSNKKQKLTLKVKGHTTNLKDIVSEGEAKCIALAGFLAELNIDHQKAAIILDDPVT